MKKIFLICTHCGNIIAMIKDCGVAIHCCGEEMKKLPANQNNASSEKHLPVYKVENGTVDVCVGKNEHPMDNEHYIEWICIETEEGFQYKHLKQKMPPRTVFFISDKDKVKAVYAFCNKHSLWKV